MSGQLGPAAPSLPDGPNPTLDTYRALRVGMVGAGLLLLVAVVVDVVRVGEIPGSISATFYSPVRSVFTGALLAVGLALVAIKGRPGWENGLLDIAGILVPLVGFVPTPVVLSSVPGGLELPVTCPDPDVACVPTELVPDVANNVAAYLLVGLAGLVFVWVRLVRAGSGARGWRRRTRLAVVVATALWALVTATFVLAREAFLNYAHYGSAITFFLLLIVVVWINGRDTTSRPGLLNMSRGGYQRSYYVIAVLMGSALLLGVVTFAITGQQSGFPIVFWLEVVLLGLYIAFWVLQTSEYWDHGAPGVGVAVGQ